MALQQKTSWLPVAVLTSSLLVLTACGGGSSSSDNTGNGGGNTTNTAPTTSNVSASTKEDTSQSVTLVGSDANSDPLTYSMVSQPAHGTVSISGSSATYTPSADFNGTDSFTYKANDGALNSNTATVNLSITAVNDAPVANPATASVTAGVSKKITLSGTDVDSKTLTASISTQPQHGSVSVNGLIATYTANANHSGTDTFAYTLSDGSATSTPASVTLTVNANTVVQPTPTGKLNDSGVTTCGDYAFNSAGNPNGHTSNNDVNCALTTDADGDAVPRGQDGQLGRDVTDNDDSDGHAGFSFTKIGSTGKALPADATAWSCVKDNVTGLIWEVKTQDGGLHDFNWEYSWYNSNSKTNGGDAGLQNSGYCQGSDCDTQSFVAAVNAKGWCGATDWRMPEVNELQGIADSSFEEPAIDQNYFPSYIWSTHSWVYWTATNYAHPDYAGSNAWFVGFNGGNDNPDNGKTIAHHVMLVRDGK
jgi:hypothetical protein